MMGCIERHLILVAWLQATNSGTTEFEQAPCTCNTIHSHIDVIYLTASSTLVLRDAINPSLHRCRNEINISSSGDMRLQAALVYSSWKTTNHLAYPLSLLSSYLSPSPSPSPWLD